MATREPKLRLNSEENDILLNPRLPEADFKILYDLAEKSQQAHSLKGHIWVATSGSTATSSAEVKLVALSKQALKSSALSVNQHLQATDQDVWTQVLPSFHVGGLGIEVRAQLSGARVVSALKEQRWDADYFYQILQKEGCTLSSLVPTQVYDLVSRKYQAPTKLRAVVVGGGAFEQSLYLRARKLGWPLLPSYGMTETASQIATASLDSLNADVYPEMTLLSHAQAQTNAEGFLQVHASSLFTGYAQMQNGVPVYWDPKVNGWFTTEDRGAVVAGALRIEGRGKDYIKIGGEGTNVTRLRGILENCALELDPTWPFQVTLLDMPSDRLGSEIQAVSTLSPEDTAKVLQLYTQRVLPFENARKINFVKEIPRSDLGKILWGELRRLL